MRLNAKILKNVENINSWQYSNQANIQEGQANSFYVQLVDLDKVPGNDKSTTLPEYPMRYIPQGSIISLVVTFFNIDDAQEFNITGVQPFADDKSIWKFSLLSTQLPKSGNFKLVLTEDGVDKIIIVKNGIAVDLINIGGC